MVVKDEIALLFASITEAVFLADTPKSALEHLQNLQHTSKNGMPFILLLLPITEKRGTKYTDVSVSFVLGTVTRHDFSTDQRQLTTFTPILEPIFDKFERLIRVGNTRIKGNYGAIIEKINQYYWGQDSTILNEYIDCIEVKNIELKIKNKNC
jgi:hypothetical protein